jgi:tetratricopeptide (TPR) repeat protein
MLGLFANFLERCERLEKAASICQTIIKRPDATPDDFAYLAHLQLALGFPEEASKTLETAPAGYRSADYYFSSARIAQALNHPDECMEFLDKAIRVDATYANAYLLQANLQMAERNYDKAIENIERFLEIEGPSYRGYQIKASALAKSKGYQAAIEFLNDRINEHGNHPLLNGLRAEAYRESGKHELALDDCNWILEQYPDFHPARLQRAELRIDTDDPTGAIADAKFIVEAGGDDATLYATLGFAYHLDNQPDQALEWLQRAVQLDPRHVGARYRLSQVYTSAGRIDESIEQLTALLSIDGKQSIPLVVRGYQHLMQSSRDKADQDFQAALELSPKEVQAIRGMALVAELRGDHKEAIQYLDKALTIDPESEECLLDRSRLSMSDYNLKAAEKDLDQVISSSPHLLPALFTRAQLHIQLGRMDQALNDLDTILKENPDFAPALIGRSAIHEIQGNDEKSQEDFDAAVELEPESADETEQQRALIASQIALAQNRFEEAIEAATLAIELNPTNEQGYLRRGGAYWYSDQFSEGWEDYNYILETLNADSIAARNGRGGCSAELGEYDVAIEDLKLAIDEARKSDTHVLPYCLNNLARALIGNDQLEEADSVLKESLDLQPRNAWVYFNRGLLRLAQKNPTLALEDFQTAVAASEPRLPPRKLAKAKAFIERAERESES